MSSRTLATTKRIDPPQKTAEAGRVFKFSLKGIPPVDEKMWAQMEAAARIPRKGRQYPTIVEAPDA